MSDSSSDSSSSDYDDSMNDNAEKRGSGNELEKVIKYAEGRGKELGEILNEISCEFATTAVLKLSEAPKLTIKPPADSAKSDEEIVPLGTTLVLAPNIEMQKPVHREVALAEQLDRFAPLRELMPQATFGHGKKVSFTF
eukprot:sb/3474400/